MAVSARPTITRSASVDACGASRSPVTSHHRRAARNGSGYSDVVREARRDVDSDSTLARCLKSASFRNNACHSLRWRSAPAQLGSRTNCAAGTTGSSVHGHGSWSAPAATEGVRLATRCALQTAPQVERARGRGPARSEGGGSEPLSSKRTCQQRRRRQPQQQWRRVEKEGLGASPAPARGYSWSRYRASTVAGS
jgi:hypothetical protein